MIRVMLVDDEPLAQEEMKRLISTEKDFQVIATASNGKEALRKLEEGGADVVFLDIDMPEMDGIETALALAKWPAPPVVVFVTGHNEYAVKAFEAHAIDYVLKPADPIRLKETFSRVSETVRLKKPVRDKLLALGQEFGAKKIAGRRPNSKERVLFDPDEVFFFHAELARVTAHLADKELIVTMPLEELEKALDPARFARSHRAYIVNLSKVEKVVPMFHENYELVMKDPKHSHVPLARRQAQEFKKKLSNW